jgi:hypothetical protein
MEPLAIEGMPSLYTLPVRSHEHKAHVTDFCLDLLTNCLATYVFSLIQNIPSYWKTHMAIVCIITGIYTQAPFQGLERPW